MEEEADCSLLNQTDRLRIAGRQDLAECKEGISNKHIFPLKNGSLSLQFRRSWRKTACKAFVHSFSNYLQSSCPVSSTLLGSGTQQ